MKIISKKVLARHENIRTIFNKIWKFLLNLDEFTTNCAVDKRTKLSGKYIDQNSYISRYSKGQISTDNIGGLIYCRSPLQNNMRLNSKN